MTTTATNLANPLRDCRSEHANLPEHWHPCTEDDHPNDGDFIAIVYEEARAVSLATFRIFPDGLMLVELFNTPYSEHFTDWTWWTLLLPAEET